MAMLLLLLHCHHSESAAGNVNHLLIESSNVSTIPDRHLWMSGTLTNSQNRTGLRLGWPETVSPCIGVGLLYRLECDVIKPGRLSSRVEEFYN
jgi:hypothetical protein